MNIPIKEVYTNTTTWIEEKDYMDNVLLTNDMITKIEIFYQPNYSEAYNYNTSYVYETKFADQVSFQITDESLIDQVMKNAKSRSIYQSDYYYGTVYYSLPNNKELESYHLNIYLEPDSTPEFIKEHFDKNY